MDKKIILENKMNLLTQATILRYQSLTIISGLGVALLGIAATAQGAKSMNIYLLIPSLIGALITAIGSLGGYIYRTRKDIIYLTKGIREWPDLNIKEAISKSEKNKGKPMNYVVELLFILFAISIILFVLAIIF